VVTHPPVQTGEEYEVDPETGRLSPKDEDLDDGGFWVETQVFCTRGCDLPKLEQNPEVEIDDLHRTRITYWSIPSSDAFYEEGPDGTRAWHTNQGQVTE
jgi:hypothetical protein